MLEKIGLPPKPALKGNEWVLDASHCQGCSSAFTFFNRKDTVARITLKKQETSHRIQAFLSHGRARKDMVCLHLHVAACTEHHCRRCGGIFCGNCTQQRTILRGQGEGPVRICDPCKKLEDAARFERYGHRKRASKVAGSSRSIQDTESDSLIKQLLGDDSNPPTNEKSELIDQVNELIGSSTSHNQPIGLEDEGDNTNQVTSVTPEMLLIQAQEQKKKWLALKKEGKGEEALQAFKRGKELERQAESLKLFMRRNQKKTTRSTVTKEKHEASKSEQKMETSGSPGDGDSNETGLKKVVHISKKKRNEDDDLLNTLKDMGWSDADLEDVGEKRVKAKTVEGELAELASSIHQGVGNASKKPITSMEVLAHKRKAVALKKEGYLAEAKEELKKAKLLEKQLEEQQMFGPDDDESDDELAELIRGLDKEGTSDPVNVADIDLSFLSNVDSHDYEDGDQEEGVTEMDMDDPEMVATLRSLGWEEEAAAMNKNSSRAFNKTVASNKAVSSADIKGSKLGGGDTSLFSMEDDFDNVEATDDDLHDPYFLSALQALGFEEQQPSELIRPVIASIRKASEKKNLEQEILFLKKEALSLKRAGKLQEAKQELRRAKLLEKEVKDAHSQHTDEEILEAFSVHHTNHDKESEVIKSPEGLYPVDDDSNDENVDVTEEDMADPELAKTLQSLGWQDDESESHTDTHAQLEPSEQQFYETNKSKTRPQLQKELLGIKRAALKLRREGKIEEAEDELKRGQMIEQIMQDLKKDPDPNDAREQTSDVIVNSKNGRLSQDNEEKSSSFVHQGRDVPKVKACQQVDIRTVEGIPIHSENESGSSQETFSVENGISITQHDSIGTHDKNQQVASDFSMPTPKVAVHSDCSDLDYKSEPQGNIMEQRSKKGSDNRPNEHLQFSILQQEILSLKRKALTYKRESKLEEAKKCLREAKALEKTLSEGSQPDIRVSDSIILQDTTNPEPSFLPAQHNTSPSSTKKHSASKDRLKLQRESLAHKRKALALRREGKTNEADAEFELAKSIEQQMEELGGTGSSFHSGDDAGSFDDIFDPELLTALKGLGWNDSEILKPTPKLETNASRVHVSVHGEPAGSASIDERKKLEEKIKSEKMRAVQLKRAGRQSEALVALRGAKQLEQKLQLLS